MRWNILLSYPIPCVLLWTIYTLKRLSGSFALEPNAGRWFVWCTERSQTFNHDWQGRTVTAVFTTQASSSSSYDKTLVDNNGWGERSETRRNWQIIAYIGGQVNGLSENKTKQIHLPPRKLYENWHLITISYTPKFGGSAGQCADASIWPLAKLQRKIGKNMGTSSSITAKRKNKPFQYTKCENSRK